MLFSNTNYHVYASTSPPGLNHCLDRIRLIVWGEANNLLTSPWYSLSALQTEQASWPLLSLQRSVAQASTVRQTQFSSADLPPPPALPAHFYHFFLRRKNSSVSYRDPLPSYIILRWEMQQLEQCRLLHFLSWTLTAVCLCQLDCNNPEWGYQTQTGPDPARFSERFLNK